MKNSKITNIFLSVLFSCFLVSCETSHVQEAVNFQRVRCQQVMGMGKEDVMKELGPPDDVRVIDDVTIFYYKVRVLRKKVKSEVEFEKGKAANSKTSVGW